MRAADPAEPRTAQGYLSPFDATVVDNLKRAGMVCLGKLNCDGSRDGFIE